MQSVVEIEFITNFREDGVLHLEIVNRDRFSDMSAAIFEALSFFYEEIDDRKQYAFPKWRFQSRRQKEKPVEMLDLGKTIIGHNQDVTLVFDKRVNTLVDVYIRSPAGLRSAFDALLHLVDFI